MCVLRAGKIVDSQEKKRHRKATKKNWMRVSVAGLGKAFRMDFEDVLVRALDMYHIMQRIYDFDQHWQIGVLKGVSRTINLGETGAFKASEISCTLALTLALLVRIVLNASLKLFCLLCPAVVCPFAQDDLPNELSLRGFHRSIGDGLFTIPLFRYGDCPSSISGNFSIEVRKAVGFVSLGNLKVGTARVTDDARVE